ncbi:MAG: enoyl-CoA hydratase-related protein, partial [Granulosicoccus sp.]
MADVVRSLRSILPADDAFHAVGQESEMINSMVSQGLTGNKGDGGFYRKSEQGQRLARDLATDEYRAVLQSTSSRAATAAKAIIEQQEPLHGLIDGSDTEALFCRNVLARVLGYAASLLGDVTESPQSIDDAMKLGFNWTRGPFEMIDALGSATVRDLLHALKQEIPAALADDAPFYQVSKDSLQVRQASGESRPIELPEGVLRFHLARRIYPVIESNRAASLYAIENDYRLIEFHSKANALTDESMAIVKTAADDSGAGIMVHNDAQHYSAGVDLNAFLAMINAADWAGIDAFLARFQTAVAALKYSPVPVVGAPSGLSLGGGFEVLMHCDRLLMHANTVVGLVESGVGLVPSGGGVKETYWRWYQATGDWEQAAWKAWMNLGYGATASSPDLARKMQYFRDGIDEQIMNRDRLYCEALNTLNELAAHYQAPQVPQFMLAGGDILQRMQDFMDKGIARGDFYPHDKTVAMQIASVICSDNGESLPASEHELYERERKAFINLARTEQTRMRIQSLMHEGKAIRN